MAKELGIPLPRVIGNSFIKVKATMLAAAAPNISKGKNIGFKRIDAYIKAESSCTYLIAILKINIITPVSAPVRQESARQGIR